MIKTILIIGFAIWAVVIIFLHYYNRATGKVKDDPYKKRYDGYGE